LAHTGVPVAPGRRRTFVDIERPVKEVGGLAALGASILAQKP